MLPAALTMAVFIALVVSGCAFFPPAATGRSDSMSNQPRKAEMPKTYDDLLADVAERAPGFGGMFINEEGSLSAYLLDTSQRAAAETAIAAVFGPERVPPGGIRVLQGKYGFQQLKAWSDRMGVVSEIPGVILTDIDEGRNRLVVGVEKIALRRLVEEKLRELGIPPEAVLVEETGPVIPLSPTR